MENPKFQQLISTPSEIIEDTIRNDSEADKSFFYYDGGVALMNVGVDGPIDTDDLMDGVGNAFKKMQEQNR